MKRKSVIQIRSTESSDAEALKAIYEQVNAYSGTLQLPFPSLELWQKRLNGIPENVYSFVALIDQEIVGNIGFEINLSPRRRHVGSFGMGVKDTYIGRGVGSRLIETVIELSDNWLNLKRIELTVYTDNQAAIALYEKFGFVIEGKSEDYAFRNGEYISVYHMARINLNR
ncbi:GNAT family N-acetyltransferase [Vibrio sp. SS-MA-C1-2]|uniref:GNAT family N-acetyltransferase n=1 Tax=Vibrio sp. SS-MA-C1-2 TaxID=2908646 RepID=UPI001F231A62|nr:GNAT family N-acetyltransferase [Vibrio sp. SS-MA-C1-2]UJF16914.1 GNAT family N-acetyltransferase [Vibrio sp. SS-MA-C1-2]